ncbi:transposase family protein [Dactylosporangium sp. NPDC005555]|uniref:transposase family protein n=1 Tax=Dactylosporangium sp. NPDC005555 TaxID=3154889 RepID=UPI0033B8C07B
MESLQLVADDGPCAAGDGLGDSDEQQGQPTQDYVGPDAVILAVGTVFYVITGVLHAAPYWRPRRRTTQRSPVGCPVCGELTGRVHAYHRRRLAALPVAGRGVVVEVRVRRLRCLTADCPQQTFREQVPELTTRWARRTRQLTALVGDLAVVVAGRAGAAVLHRLGMRISRCTVLRVLLGTPVPEVPVPAVLSGGVSVGEVVASGMIFCCDGCCRGHDPDLGAG